MGNNTWKNALDPHPVARGSAKNTFTSYQDVSPLPLPMSYANELKVGTKLDISAVGEFSTTGTPTLSIGLIYGATAGAAGGVAVGQSAVITTASGVAAIPFMIQWYGIVTAVGASGVLYGSGILTFPTALDTLTTRSMPPTAAARSVTIDTTVAKLWGVGAAWGTSNVANTITVDAFNVQIINQGKT